jgi:hypothetical protein
MSGGDIGGPMGEALGCLGMLFALFVVTFVFAALGFGYWLGKA